MKKYTFEELNPIEFEDLVNDLLEKEYNVRIERFKEGRDRGIDGRFTDKEGEKVIIQTKHYLKTGYNGLKQVLEKKIKIINGVKKESGELVKVEKLKKSGELDKYIFVTSISLNPDNKKEIYNIFNGYIDSESDIFGPDDLNNILSKNKDIEINHNKLWLTSTNVLENIFKNIINNDIIGRSKDEIKKYIEKNKYFYVTKDFNNAINILNKNNVIIITGEPGIGKSTLSEQLCLKFLSKGEFKFFKVSKDINEVEKIWKNEEEQLFYFDDFLGSNYLENIEGDNEIKNFIDRIKRTKNKKDIKNKIFILNSRTTILKSGIENSAINGFKEDIEENKFVLEVKKLSEEEKAHILYNHMFFSDLGIEYINKIYEEKNYKKIINHKNYNPRLIEFITNKKRVNVEQKEYIKFIINNLDNPKEIWKKVFEKQSNPYVNHLVHLTVFNGGVILEEILKNRYNIFTKKLNNGIVPPNYEFDNVIEIAIENFLIRNNTKGNITYSLINPSITDFILNRYIKNEDFLIDIFDDLGTYEGLKELNNLYRNGINNTANIFNIFNNFFTGNKNNIKLNSNIYNKVIYGLYEKGLENKNNNYKIFLFDLGYKEEFNKIVIQNIQIFIDNYIKINDNLIGVLFYFITIDFKELNISNDLFLIKYLKQIDIDEGNIESIGEILDYFYNKEGFNGYNEELLDILKEKIEEYLEKEMKYIFENIDFNDYMGDNEDALDFSIDILIDEKIGDIQVILDDLSKYYFISYIEGIDVQDIYDGLGIDLESEYKDYLELQKSYNYDGDEYDRYKDEKMDKLSEIDSISEIDYIFSK